MKKKDWVSDGARTVDALRVGDGSRGAQSVVVLLVAHQGVHSQDGCKKRKHHCEHEKLIVSPAAARRVYWTLYVLEFHWFGD